MEFMRQVYRSAWRCNARESDCDQQIILSLITPTWYWALARGENSLWRKCASHEREHELILKSVSMSYSVCQGSAAVTHPG